MEQQIYHPDSSSKKSSVSSIIISVILTAIIIGSLVYWWTSHNQAQKTENSSVNISGAMSNGVNDVHHWNNKPVEITDINFAKGLFDLPDGYVKAWDIGAYSDDDYQSQLDGARMILVAIRDIVHSQGPFGTEPTGVCDALARILIFKAPSGNSFVVYDQQYSSNAGEYNFIFKNIAPINPNAQFYSDLGSGIFIPSLNFPGFVVHGSQTFVLQKSFFPCYAIDTQGKTHIFFDDIKSSLQPAGFSDPMLGTAYSDKSTGGIVFRASDGTYVRYNPL